MSSSILKGLGKPEWIAETPAQFAAIVAGLCADLPALRAAKQGLRSRVLASPLFDGVDLSRHIEQAFFAMRALATPDPQQEKAPGTRSGGLEIV
jgi:predicted O-linked N-acetylglucosamine transferase (SPINDLY family)